MFGYTEPVTYIHHPVLVSSNKETTICIGTAQTNLQKKYSQFVFTKIMLNLFSSWNRGEV